ncbi:MAG: alpha/beta hydrolase [Candidatus Eremiobacteraeota bacterium]|nr:alpha/beta hydrolase [Candidatus Eremiobacteraeota bacterium]
MNRRQFLIAAPLSLLALRQMAWGEPGKLVEIDPHCLPDAFNATMEYLRQMRAAEKPISAEEKLENGRAWLAGAEVTDLKPGEKSYWVELPKSSARLRVLLPAGELRGAVLAIHGGGWVLGTALSDEKRNWALARRIQAAVVSPDYRLAPENPFPAGPDDCEAAARWLLGNSLGVSQLAITGGSAGSHLAALTLCRLNREERARFKSAVLFYGVFDLGRSDVWRSAENSDFPDLSPEDMNRYLNYFVPDKTDEQRRHSRYSPLYADLNNMPPALLMVGTADLLASDSRQMAQKWADAGNRAVLVQYPGAPHGFNGYDVDCGLDPEEYMADFIRESWS